VDFGLVIIICVLAVVGFYFLEQYKKKNQVYCTFRTPTRTKEEKWVSLKAKYVIFRGGKYRVNPKMISLLWWNRGILGTLKLGYWVPSLDFRWDTDQALDPDTFEPTWDTPETRALLDSEDEFGDFAKHAQPTGSKKGSTFEKLLPWVMLGILVIVAFWIFQMQGQMAAIQELIKVK